MGRALGPMLGVVGGEIGPVLGVVGGEIGPVLGVVGGAVSLTCATMALTVNRLTLDPCRIPISWSSSEQAYVPAEQPPAG
jgi:hypothetical protein